MDGTQRGSWTDQSTRAGSSRTSASSFRPIRSSAKTWIARNGRTSGLSAESGPMRRQPDQDHSVGLADLPGKNGQLEQLVRPANAPVCRVIEPPDRRLHVPTPGRRQGDGAVRRQRIRPGRSLRDKPLQLVPPPQIPEQLDPGEGHRLVGGDHSRREQRGPPPRARDRAAIGTSPASRPPPTRRAARAPRRRAQWPGLGRNPTGPGARPGPRGPSPPPPQVPPARPRPRPSWPGPAPRNRPSSAGPAGAVRIPPSGQLAGESPAPPRRPEGPGSAGAPGQGSAPARDRPDGSAGQGAPPRRLAEVFPTSTSWSSSSHRLSRSSRSSRISAWTMEPKRSSRPREWAGRGRRRPRQSDPRRRVPGLGGLDHPSRSGQYRPLDDNRGIDLQHASGHAGWLGNGAGRKCRGSPGHQHLLQPHHDHPAQQLRVVHPLLR